MNLRVELCSRIYQVRYFLLYAYFPKSARSRDYFPTLHHICWNWYLLLNHSLGELKEGKVTHTGSFNTGEFSTVFTNSKEARFTFLITDLNEEK